MTWARNFKLAATVTVSLSDQAQAAASHGDHDCQGILTVLTVTDSSHCDCPGRSQASLALAVATLNSVRLDLASESIMNGSGHWQHWQGSTGRLLLNCWATTAY